MSDLFNAISTNDLLAGLALLVISLIINALLNYRDKNKIYSFLDSSRRQSNMIFRSTEAIAAHTKLTEGRVEKLCTKHPKIRRNEKEKQSWRLID